VTEEGNLMDYPASKDLTVGWGMGFDHQGKGSGNAMKSPFAE
jgi:hypothetical protein